MAAPPSAIRNRAASSDERRRLLAEKTAALDAFLSPRRTPSVAGERGHETEDFDSEQAGRRRPSELAADEGASADANQVEPAADAVAKVVVSGSESEDEVPDAVCVAAVGSDADGTQPLEAQPGGAAECKAQALDAWFASLPKQSEPEPRDPAALPRSSLPPPVPSVSDEDRLRIQQGRTPAGIAPSVVEEVLGSALKPESGPSKYVPFREFRGGPPVSTAAKAPLEPVPVGVEWAPGYDMEEDAAAVIAASKHARHSEAKTREKADRLPNARRLLAITPLVCAQRATSYIGGEPHVVAKAMLRHLLGWAPSTLCSMRTTQARCPRPVRPVRPTAYTYVTRPACRFS